MRACKISVIADAIAKKESRQVNEKFFELKGEYRDGNKSLETRFNKVCTYSSRIEVSL